MELDSVLIRRDSRYRIVAKILALLGLWAATTVGSTAAAPPLQSARLADVFVQTPLQLTVDAQRLDKAIESILQRIPEDTSRVKAANFGYSGWTYWLDRHVDPSQTVSLKQAGPTAAAVIDTIAAQLELSYFPLPGVLVIGRPRWVQQTLANVQHSPRSEPISLAWPRGTTAADVLLAILDAPSTGTTGTTGTTEAAGSTGDPPSPAERRKPSSGSPSFPWLPHDVWRSGRWTSIDRRMAAGLVLAQFDLSLAPTAALRQLRSDTTPRPNVVNTTAEENLLSERFPIAYPAGDTVDELRKLARRLRPAASVRSTAGQIVITGSPASHQRLLAEHWKTSRPSSVVSDQADSHQQASAATFDLRLKNRPALDVLKQLAATAGKRLEVTDAAQQPGQTLISLDAKQKTLQSLSRQVAEAAELTIRWESNLVRVTTASENPANAQRTTGE